MPVISPPRRLPLLLTAVLVLAVPAAILRATCPGGSCASEVVEPDVPFCSLGDLRREIARGYREGRSPDVLAVTHTPRVATQGTAWPSLQDDPFVPLAFAGPAGGFPVPAGTTLDAVAPTLAAAIGLRRAHPEVRSGEPIPGVEVTNPRLVMIVIVAGLGSTNLGDASDEWPVLEGLVREGGTREARPGSLPLDPAAVATTIGTGGVPRQHGITGTRLRNDSGELVRMGSADAPVSVIATLADDLDRSTGDSARVGLVAPSPRFRGAIGGDWYLGGDKDDMKFVPPRATFATVAEVLRSGYGDDGTTDLFVVVLPASRHSDRTLGRLLALAEEAASGRWLAAVTTTGAASVGEPLSGAQVAAAAGPAVAGVVEATTPGGLFLSPRALARSGTASRDVVTALRTIGDDGGMLFADVFPELAVAFGRYC